MNLIGVEFIRELAEREHFSAKMVFNKRGAIFFPVKLQHRDQKAEGISYEDEYKGDALAAMLAPGKIEVRFHKCFTDEAVAGVLEELLSNQNLEFMQEWSATYQGRSIR